MHVGIVDAAANDETARLRRDRRRRRHSTSRSPTTPTTPRRGRRWRRRRRRRGARRRRRNRHQGSGRPDGSSELATVINVLRADLALRTGLQRRRAVTGQISEVRATTATAGGEHQRHRRVDNSGRLGAAIVMNILLFLLLQTYGSWVLGGVTREKSSRVVEVLLSSVRPRQLLFGKILGIGVVALVHMLVLATCALVTAQHHRPRRGRRVPVGDVVVAGVWFILGYLLYCCAFAAAGSLCSRQEDAQGAATPIMLPLLPATSSRSRRRAARPPCCGCWRSSRRPPCCACRCSPPPARRRSGRCC